MRCSRADQRRRRRCLAPKQTSWSGTGCCSQPLPPEHRCVRLLKVLFLLLCISRLHGCYFSGWGSLVDSFLVSETSTFTIDNGDEARKGRTTEPWHFPPNGQMRSATANAHPKKHVCFDKKKSSGIFFYTSTSRIFCCRPLCIAPVQLQNKVIGDWPLRAAGGIGIYMHDAHQLRTLACGWKGKTTDFRSKKGKSLSEYEAYLKLKC